MFKKEANLNVIPEKKKESNELPYLVEYIYRNVPLKALPVNSIGIFIGEACDILGVMLNMGIKIPIIIYKVSGKSYSFFNYKLELVGGLVFSDDLNSVQTFGKDFKEKGGFVTYKLMGFDFKYSETISLIEKKFQSRNIFEYNK